MTVGYVSTVEPFARLVNQGMILGEVEFTGYRGSSGGWVSAGQQSGSDIPMKVSAENVEKQGEHFVLRDAPNVRVESRAYKMSKSRGNVVNPDKIVREFGADALRLYEMFMGPLEATKPWSTSGVGGVEASLIVAGGSWLTREPKMFSLPRKLQKKSLMMNRCERHIACLIK